jgi:cobalt-zinc-cadmium efflux system outer membrane protein
MTSRQRTCAAFFFVLFCGIVPRLGSAQNQPQSTNLTLEQALNRARVRAPILLSARARIEEARARLRGSSILQQTNPMIEGTVGPRFSDPSNFTAADVSVSQDFEAFGRRSARIAGAQAGVSREIAASHETARQLLRDVATSFAKALAASERLKVIAAGDQLASAFLDTAQRRFQAGDIPVLEVNLAKNSAARTRAALLSGRAELADALGELRLSLGIPTAEELSVSGDLRNPGKHDLDALILSAEDRPDIRVLESELQQALSDARLGNTFKSPDFGVIGRYQRDQGDNIAQAGVRISIPVFSRGQELTGTGNARANRIRAELEASKTAIRNEVRSAFEVYTHRSDAAQELEQRALPSLDENETLARRSYEEGELGLAELLLIRKETLETRLLYVNTLLDAFIAGVDLQSKAGFLK